LIPFFLLQVPALKPGERLPQTLGCGSATISTAHLASALLKNGIPYVRVFIYGQKDSNPFFPWFVAEIESLLPPELRGAIDGDVSVQLSIRKGKL
jgi:hypothetical protein